MRNQTITLIHNSVIILFHHYFSNDGQLFGGSVYQKVRPDLETGVQLSWKMGSNDTTFGIACKYQLDSDASVRAKINNNSQIGLGYQQKLREGSYLISANRALLLHQLFASNFIILIGIIKIKILFQV